MYAERQARYPKGTYKVMYARQNGNTEYCMVNLTTGRQSRSRSIWDMVKNIEYDISANKFPQSAIQYRSWSTSAQGESKKDSGKVISIDSARNITQPELLSPTFVIKILYRQNATWQGTIQWIEGRQTMQYRSVNELLKLMEEAAELTNTQESPTDR